MKLNFLKFKIQVKMIFQWESEAKKTITFKLEQILDRESKAYWAIINDN